MIPKFLAHWLFPLGLIGLGALSLLYGDFALTWQPVPPWVPRVPWAYLSGALLVGGGAALLWPQTVRAAANGMTLFLLSWLVLLQLPRVADNPREAAIWLGFGETLLLVAGGWAWAICFGATKAPGETGTGRSEGVARRLVGVALPLIGWAHFVYVDATAGMIPAWLPARHALAYLTGAGHVAAGFALLAGIVPRLAATAEAAMIGCFVVLLHGPMVAAAPHDRTAWTMLAVAMAMDGAMWAVAAGLGGETWWRPRRDTGATGEKATTG